MKEKIRCSQCLMTNDYPGLTFNEKGICEFCTKEKKREKIDWEGKKKELENKIEAIKREADRYHAIIPWSGGKDSSFALYVMKVLYGLKVLAVNFDNGFKSKRARQNIEHISRRLDIDVVTIQPNRKLMNDLYGHYLRRKGELCSVCNVVGYVMICSFIFSQKALYGYLPLIVGGWSGAHENVRSLFTFDFTEFKRVVEKDKALYQQFEENVLVNNHVCSLLASVGDPRSASSQMGGELSSKFFQLPDYLEWDLVKIKKILKNEVGWISSDSLTSAHEDCQWHNSMKYLMLKKYEIDPDTIAISAMVRANRISREEGLAALNKNGSLKEADNNNEPDDMEGLLSLIACSKKDINRMSDWYREENNKSNDVLYWQSFQRNIGIVTKEEQQKLKESRIAIAGTGGVGGIYMADLARAGVEKFVISDPDSFDYTNLNRQYGATVQTVGQNKAEVMKKIITAINPDAEVTIVEGGLKKDNIPDFLEGCNLVLDCLDAYTLSELIELHQAARGKNLYSLKAVPMGFGASLMVFDPEGMSFNEYFGIDENEDLTIEKLFPHKKRLKKLFQSMMRGFSPTRLFAGYLDPNIYNPFSKKGEFTFQPFPSICPSVSLCSALATTEAILILLGRRKPIAVPKCLEIDLYRRIFKISEP